jgi:(p)ppGpp synthase/HD superfamily hydrolase
VSNGICQEETGFMLSERFDDALAWASALHREQVRKLSKEDQVGGRVAIPYISHLLSVSALVIEHGGSEDQAIAALLHDAIEDVDAILREDIAERYGDAVAQIVEDCTDAWEQPKPPWSERKRRYIEGLHKKDEASLLVSLADKVHNARSIWLDYLADGDAVWERFNPPRENVLWYYDELAKVFAARFQTPPELRLVNQLTETVRDLLKATGATPAPPA